MGNCLRKQERVDQDKHHEMTEYLRQGISSQATHQYDEAVNNIKRSIDLAKQLGDHHHKNLGHQILLKLYPKMGRHAEMEGYLRLGIAHQEKHEYDEAIDSFKKSIDLAKELGDGHNEMKAYGCLGSVFQETHQFDDAVDNRKKCLDLTKVLGNKEQDMIAHLSLGILYAVELSQYNEGLIYLTRGIEIASELGDAQREMEACFSIGTVHLNLGQHENAATFFKKHINLAKELGNTQYENIGLRCLQMASPKQTDRCSEMNEVLRLANVCLETGEYDNVLTHCKKCIEIARELGDTEQVIKASLCLGKVLMKTSQYDGAAVWIKIGIDLAQDIGDTQHELLGYHCLVNMYHERKQCDFASLDIKDVTELELEAYIRLAALYIDSRQYEDAVDYSKRSMNIAKEIGYREQEMMACGFLRNIYQETHQYEDAVDNGKRCIDLAKALGDREQEMVAYKSLASVYQDTHQYEDAVDNGKRCIDLAKALGDREQEMAAYKSLASVYHDTHQYEDAVDCNKKCIDLAKELDDKVEETLACGRLAKTYMKMGKCNDALITSLDYVDSLDDSEENQQELQPYILGMKHFKMGQYNDAVEDFKKGIDPASESGNVRLEYACYSGLQMTYLSMGRLDDGIICIKKTIELLKELGDEEQALEAYLRLANIYMAIDQFDDAVTYFKTCINLAKEQGNRKQEIEVHLSLGEAYWRMTILNQHATSCQDDDNSVDNGIQCGLECLKIAKEINDKYYEMKAHLLLATTQKQKHLGDAYLHANEGLKIAENRNETFMKEEFKNVLDTIHRSVGTSDGGLSDSKTTTAVTEMDENNDRTWDWKTEQVLNAEKTKETLRLWSYYRSTHEYKRCIECLEKLKELATNSNDKVQYSNCLADCYIVDLKQEDKALQCCEEALSEARKCTNNELLFDFYRTIAELYFSTLQIELSKMYYRKAIQCFDGVYGSLGGLDEFKLSITDKFEYISCVDMLGFLLLVTSQREECLLTLDYCRGRVLREILMSNYGMMTQPSKEQSLQYADVELFLSNNNLSLLFYSFVVNSFVAFVVNEHISTFLIFEAKVLRCIDAAFDTMQIRQVTNCEDRSLQTEDDIIGNKLELDNRTNLSIVEKIKAVQSHATDNHVEMNPLGKLNVTQQYPNTGNPATAALNDLGSKMESILPYFIKAAAVMTCKLTNENEIAIVSDNTANITSQQDSKTEKPDNAAVNVEDIVQVLSNAFKNLSLGNMGSYQAEEPEKLESCEATDVVHQDIKGEIVITPGDSINFADRREKETVVASCYSEEQEQTDTGKQATLNDVSQQIPRKLLVKSAVATYIMKQCIDQLVSGGSLDIFAHPEETEIDKQLHEKNDIKDTSNIAHVITDEGATSNLMNNADDWSFVAPHDQNTENKQERSKAVSIDHQMQHLVASAKVNRNIYEEPWEDDEDENGATNILKTLYKMLIKNQDLLDHDEVVIIPDGPIHNIPFAALQDPDTGCYLSETKRIRLAPSIQSLVLAKQSPDDFHYKTGALIIGDPAVGRVILNGREKFIEPLQGAREEAKAIAKVLGVRPLIGDGATKDVVIEKLKEGVSVVHIAAHGILSKATIVLAPTAEVRAKKIPDEEDYMLTMADVQKAQVRAKLVVLGCCHSGRGEIKTEGVVGMCRAFLASGARAVVASLWAIEDTATLIFMKQFYSFLKQGKSACASLQETMRYMREETRFNEPKFWAPFFLIGDDVTMDFQSSDEKYHDEEVVITSF